MSDELDLQAVWAEVNVEIRKGAINRSLWEAAAAAKAVAIDGDAFVVGLTPAEMRLAGYLTTPANRVQLESIIARLVGRRLNLTTIEGQTPEAYARWQERQASTIDHALQQAEFRSAHQGALGIWEELSPTMHKLFTETGVRRFPEPLARLLIKTLPVIADAEDRAREAEPEAEQLHFTHLNRAFDKLSTYTDIPAPIVALEYLRYRTSRRRQQ